MVHVLKFVEIRNVVPKCLDGLNEARTGHFSELHCPMNVEFTYRQGQNQKTSAILQEQSAAT